MGKVSRRGEQEEAPTSPMLPWSVKMAHSSRLTN